MNRLTPEAKAVLRIIVSEIDKQDLEARLISWRGLSHLTSEESEAGQIARANAQLLRSALERQHDFLAVLEPNPAPKYLKPLTRMKSPCP